MLIPTRSFGDFLLKSEMDKPAWKQVISVVPQIVSHRLNSSWDFVVVASDGVWDAVTNRDLVALVRDRLNDDDGKKKKVGDIILCLQSARARFNVEQFNLGKAPLPPSPLNPFPERTVHRVMHQESAINMLWQCLTQCGEN